MKYISIPAKYFCGIDLHKHTMYACVMDRPGNILLHRNMACNFETLLIHIEPFLPDLAVGVESVHNYYWLFDACQAAGIPFYLGHAFYMKAVHGGKTQNDRLDSREITNLMRTNYFPPAYPYPKEKRSTRDLLRRRHGLVRLRAGYYKDIQTIFTQHCLLDVKLKDIKNKNRRRLIERFSDPALQTMIATNLDMIEFLTPKISMLERQIIQQAKHHNPRDYNMLMTVPGLGEILTLTILYEIDTIKRFETVQLFSSYCRLVKCEKLSAGKIKGMGNPKIGNPNLKWAFTQIIITAQRVSPVINKFYQRLQSKYGVKRAKIIIAHKFAVAIYFMLKNGKAFDEKQFVQTSMK